MYLPLSNNSEEEFSVSISDITYSFKQRWNTEGFWTLDIIDFDGGILVYGVVLVTKIYLLKQFPQIRFDLIGESELDPTRNNLDAFPLRVVYKDV